MFTAATGNAETAARRNLVRIRRRELHLRHRALGFRRCEVGVVSLESGHACDNVVWEQRNVRVVSLNRVVITLALDRDAILRTCQFVLQTQEILVRLELRIILNDEQKAAECTIQLAVRGDPVLRSLRATQGRARLGNVVVDGLFVCGEALDRLHEIRNQGRTAIEDNIHLRPIGLDRFIQRDHLVAARNVHAAEKQREDHQYRNDSEKYLHEWPPPKIYHSTTATTAPSLLGYAARH